MAQESTETTYNLKIERQTSGNLKFINKTGFEVKGALYNRNDNSMAIPFNTFNVKPGKTGTYTNGTYNVQIFNPQFIDKLLSTKKNVSGDLQMSGSESSFSGVRIFTRNLS